MENSSSILHSKNAISLKPLWFVMIGLVIIESLLAFLPEGIMTQTLRFRMHEIVSLPAPRVQIMGDSVCAAIRAANVAEAAGLPEGSISNYALPGTSPLFTWFTLRRELAAGRSPKFIVYAPHPATLRSPLVERFFGRFATAGEAAELVPQLPLSDTLFGAACRLSYTLRYREELQTVVTQTNLAFFHTMKGPVVSVQASQVKLAETQIPDPNVTLFNKGSLPPRLTAPFSVAPLNLKYIDKFCDLAAEHNIRIAWVSMPTIAALKQGGAGDTSDGRYFALLDGIAARHPNVTVLHRDIDVLPDSYFADQWHLNRYGAMVFSRQLGTWLAPWLEANGLNPSFREGRR